MTIRDRIKDFRRVRADRLRPNPRNWRLHPARQREALRGVLEEIGYVDALLARELPDGTLELIDGHLRAETTPETEVPVLVVDLDDQEATKVLVTFDPLTAMAQTDKQRLEELLFETQSDNQAVEKLLASTAERAGLSRGGQLPEPPEVLVPESWTLLIDCSGEEEQRRLYERLSGEGIRCRVLTL